MTLPLRPVSIRGWALGLARPIREHPWIWGAVALIGASVAFVVLTGMRPQYDAYGWLVWGHQAAHLDLDTNAAPSWKPLTFLFTFPYALAGRGALWLWMVTAVAAAFAGLLFAGRIAYRLTGPSRERRYAPVAAAIFAALGVLGLGDYWHYILIAASDPMMVSLCLAAIDCHLSRRPKLAWLALVLAALGRPEVWPVTAVYAIWAWRTIPSFRALLVAGLAAIPALWFGVAALTSPSWSIAGDIATSSTAGLPRHGIWAVLSGFFGLYELPLKVAVLGALVLAILRRERTSLVLTGTALAWVAVEVAFALHGWTGAARYMFEPAAVTVVLVGAAVGRVLAISPRRVPLLRWAAVAVVAALVAALVPPDRSRVALARDEITFLRSSWAPQINRLRAVIAKDGGPKRFLACGQPVTEVAFQSILAWELGQNVADVGWDPNTWVKQGKPIVLFEPSGQGWNVQAIHTTKAKRAGCSRLSREAG
jgi:hypothetical protein